MIHLSLERIEKILKVLGDPEKRLPPVFHVAGTNGKGSTLAFLKSILEEAGYTVHRYTSPHLVDLTERFEVRGSPVSMQQLGEILENIHLLAKQYDIHLTPFEELTAAAFELFAREPADVLLLEVGLGGRLDATNVIETPLVSIVTAIDFDHQEYLGSTLEKIAFEKAGIFKEGCPVVIAPQRPSVEKVFQEIAALKNCPLWQFQEPFPQSCELGLYGEHQRLNAQTALTALKAQDYFVISDKAIKNGLLKARWRGRLDHFTDLFPYTLWIDGAHNEAGFKTLEVFFTSHPVERPLTAIVGIRKDKNAFQMLSHLKTFVDQAFFVPLEEGGYCPKDLLEIGASIGLQSCVWENFLTALAQIKEGTVLLTGSLYLVGEFYRKLLNKHQISK